MHIYNCNGYSAILYNHAVFLNSTDPSFSVSQLPWVVWRHKCSQAHGNLCYFYHPWCEPSIRASTFTRFKCYISQSLIPVPVAQSSVFQIHNNSLNRLLKINQIYSQGIQAISTKWVPMWTYLLHDFDTSKGIATHCQSQCRSPHRLGCTGLCCPTWAYPQPPPSPSSPDPHRKGSFHPVLG